MVQGPCQTIPRLIGVLRVIYKQQPQSKPYQTSFTYIYRDLIGIINNDGAETRPIKLPVEIPTQQPQLKSYEMWEHMKVPKCLRTRKTDP